MSAPARAKPLTLYDAATAKGRVIRQGDIVQLVMDGSGALVCPSQDFLLASKWAQSRTASGNLLTDRGRFLDKLEVLVSRPGTVVSSRGSNRQIEMLAKQMVGAGYDLGEWGLPFEVKQALAATAAAANPANAKASVKKAPPVPSDPPPAPVPEPPSPAKPPLDWL